MVIQELFRAKNVILQLVWGDRLIEFHTEIFDRDDNGVYATPYLHKGQPLELEVTAQGGVVCNVFGDDPGSGNRISWRNIDLHTVRNGDEVKYYLQTLSYNELANYEDRRNEERVLIVKNGTVWDDDTRGELSIRILDISNKGIAFYAPTSYTPRSNAIVVSFEDNIDEHEFAFRLNCKIVRTKRQSGNVMYGCRVVDDDKNYLLYGCLKRLKKNAKVENFDE